MIDKFGDTYESFCKIYYPDADKESYLMLNDFSYYILMLSGICCITLGLLLMLHPKLKEYPNFLYGLISFLEGQAQLYGNN